MKEIIPVVAGWRENRLSASHLSGSWWAHPLKTSLCQQNTGYKGRKRVLPLAFFSARNATSQNTVRLWTVEQFSMWQNYINTKHKYNQKTAWVEVIAADCTAGRCAPCSLLSCICMDLHAWAYRVWELWEQYVRSSHPSVTCMLSDMWNEIHVSRWLSGKRTMFYRSETHQQWHRRGACLSVELYVTRDVWFPFPMIRFYVFVFPRKKLFVFLMVAVPAYTNNLVLHLIIPNKHTLMLLQTRVATLPLRLEDFQSGNLPTGIQRRDG